MLEKLGEATYCRNWQPLLQAANLRLEVVRHLWRLAYELKAAAMQN